MKKHIKFACPLNCFDSCALIATVVDGRVTRIKGNRHHPLTKGNACKKGRALVKRLYHPQRLTVPKKRTAEGWVDISWSAAIDIIAATLSRVIANHGPLAILKYADSGYGGLIKRVDEVFFNCLGGVTIPHGSLCWGAGMAAQEYDFGQVRSHDPDDIENAKTIILWGRNPVDTNMHVVPHVKQARKKGATVILIDPIKTASVSLSDHYFQIRPGTDGALALGMIAHTISNNRHDKAFIQSRVWGFERFKNYVLTFTPERVADITGIDAKAFCRLADRYACEKPGTILLGYGLQRYQNGGNTVRCIDALGAITGNIGKSGGGINFANKTISEYIAGDLKKSKAFIKTHRSFELARMGEFLQTAKNPPIKCLFILKANPLVQIPHINKTLNAFQAIPFKVVIDMFMTDTARYADLVLPCTSVLEEEDFIYNSMYSPYLNFSQKVVPAPEGVMSEYDFFIALARKMGLGEYPVKTREAFLKDAFSPLLKKLDAAYEELKNGYCKLPESQIPWRNGRFHTPSGKFELYSQKAKERGHSPMPTFTEPQKPSVDFPFRLLTPHYRDSLHSQHFAFVDDIPRAHLNSKTMKKMEISDGGLVRISSKQGHLKARVRLNTHIGDDIIMIYQGWWHKSGSVNFLTDDCLSDVGDQAAFNDTFCTMVPIIDENG